MPPGTSRLSVDYQLASIFIFKSPGIMPDVEGKNFGSHLAPAERGASRSGDLQRSWPEPTMRFEKNSSRFRDGVPSRKRTVVGWARACLVTRPSNVKLGVTYL